MSHIVLNGRTQRANTVFCIGRNYAAHISELGNQTPEAPLVFLKPNNCLLNSGSRIVLPGFSRSVHYEAELVLLISRDCDRPDAQIMDVVAGYAVGLDLTARDIQDYAKTHGLPWTQAKGFKGAACISDFIPAAELPDPAQIEFTFTVDGRIRQHGHTAQMLRPIPQLLCHLAEIYGLRQGDLVFTGTPEGVGELASGQQLALDLAGKVSARFEVV